jgi:predicted transposase YbfD/YdcC
VSSSPIAVLSCYLGQVDEVPAAARPGLLAALDSVPDPRKKRGVRHRFSSILLISVCAVISGARSFAAIAEWAADTAEDLLSGMGITAPDASTIRRALSAFSGDGFDDAIGAWLGGRLADAPPRKGRRERRAIAVDGKWLRGSRTRDDRAVMVMACLDHDSGVVLAQTQIDDKSNEIPAFAPLLDTIDDLREVVVTADALHAQTEHANYLHTRGAHYVLTVKGNQKKLRNQLASQPWKKVPIARREKDTRHGRVVTRTYKVITIEAGIEFPHAVQAVQIVRTRQRKGSSNRATRETMYAVTSLSAGQAGPAELASYVQCHWTIENRLHWVRDVTMGEDASRVRTGGGPRMMASLRNLAVSLLRLAGHANIAKALRHNARNPKRAIDLILTS